MAAVVEITKSSRVKMRPVGTRGGKRIDWRDVGAALIKMKPGDALPLPVRYMQGRGATYCIIASAITGALGNGHAIVARGTADGKCVFLCVEK